MDGYRKSGSTHGRVLVVEDEPSIRSLLEVALQEANFHVCTAADGDTARSILQRISFDVLLLDYKMPGLTGLELSGWIRQWDPDIPIALLSGSLALINDEDIALAGITCTFSKPFDLGKLICWIVSVLS